MAPPGRSANIIKYDIVRGESIVTLHILIAEDEQVIAMTLADVLESEGFRVTLARDGREALEAEDRDAADLLVTDMRMPVMGGAELIQAIRQRRPELPVIAITGYSEATPARESGRLAVLLKPFNLGTLVSEVRALTAGAVLSNGREATVD